MDTTEETARLTASPFTDVLAPARQQVIEQLRKAARDEDKLAAAALIDGNAEDRYDHADNSRAFWYVANFLEAES